MTAHDMFLALGYEPYGEQRQSYRNSHDKDMVKTITMSKREFAAYAFTDNRFPVLVDAVLSVDELRAVAAWYRERGITI